MDVQYKIIGGDGREYGPASLEELKAWIRDGRAAGTTQTWRDDVAMWAPAASYVELADEIGSLRPGTFRAAALEEAIPVGFWARLAAYLVDMIIVSIIVGLVWSIISLATGIKVPEFNPVPQPTDLEGLLQAFSAYIEQLRPVFWIYMLSGRVVHLVYDVCFNGRFGATPGKMLIGARIVRADGSPLGYGRAALRWLAARVSDFSFGIGYLFIAVRSDKRALHDLMAGTKVIYKR